jgi:hypothetical protein
MVISAHGPAVEIAARRLHTQDATGAFFLFFLKNSKFYLIDAACRLDTQDATGAYIFLKNIQNFI